MNVFVAVLPFLLIDPSPSCQLLLEVSVFPFIMGLSLKPYRCLLLHIYEFLCLHFMKSAGA